MEDNKSLVGGITTDLSTLVDLGMRTEAEQSMALRTIRLGIASSACRSIQQLHMAAEQGMTLLSKLTARHAELLEEQYDTMTLSSLESEIEWQMKRALEVANLEVKMAQGKDLFPEDTMSAEDRRLLRMFSQLSTPEDKDRFLKALESAFDVGDSFDASESESDGCYGDGAGGGEVSSAGKEVTEDAVIVEEASEPQDEMSTDAVEEKPTDAVGEVSSDSIPSKGTESAPLPPKSVGFKTAVMQDEEFPQLA